METFSGPIFQTNVYKKHVTNNKEVVLGHCALE